MKKNKIVYIDQFTYPAFIGGAQISMFNLLKDFKKNGYEVVIYGQDVKKKIELNGIKIKPLQNIVLAIYEEEPEFVFTQLNIAQEVIKICNNMQVKSVLFVRSFVEHFCDRAFKRYGGICTDGKTETNLLKCKMNCGNLTWERNKDTFRKANLIVSNSKYMQKVVKRFFNRSSVLQYPTITKDTIKIKKKEQKYITCIAANKGENVIEDIIKAFPEEKFIILDKEFEYYKSKFNNVIGSSLIQDIVRWVKKTKILLACPKSFLEAFGRTPAEFGQYGIPSISSKQGGLPESTGKGGLLVDNYRNSKEWIKKIKTLTGNNKLYLKLSKKAIKNAEKFQNNNTLLKVLKIKDRKKRKISREKRRKKKIYFITENCHFYSGGRYFNYEIIKGLVELGYDLTVFTNQMPSFTDDFGLYQNEKVVLHRFQDLDKCLEKFPKPDLVIGTPVWGNVHAVKYAKKNKVKCLCQILDPLNLLEKNHPETINQENIYFEPMIEPLKSKQVDLFVMTEDCKRWTREWIGKENIEIIAPVVNSRILNTVKNYKKKNWICYVSRMVDRKNYKDSLKAFAKTNKKWELHIITSLVDYNIYPYLKELGIEKRVKLHNDIDDYQKFEIMKKSKIMINSSLFEGYGMWVIEGLACGMDVVCYKQNNFIEIAKNYIDRMYMADFREYKHFEYLLLEATKKYKPRKEVTEFNYDSKMLNQLRKVIDKILI